MIVLGRPHLAYGSVIEVPPFHTGHLGLVPGTEANLYLISQTKEGKCNCEVIVTPLDRKVGNIMQITVVMLDQPGVVSRLLRSISDLNINILSEESSSINHLNHHYINLLVDWSSSPYRNDDHEASPSTQRRYRDFHEIFPVYSVRCVFLFNSIMARCADVIEWDSSPRHPLPKLRFRHLSIGSNEDARGHTSISRHDSKKYVGALTIPPNLMAQIRQRVGYSSSEHIPYLLISDTEDRALRVFFPTDEENSRIIHVALQHNDLPGALTAITGVVANASFSILTSLHRKKTSARSVWEAVLECPSNAQLPVRTTSAEWPRLVFEWLAKQITLTATPEDIYRLKTCDIVITQPDYPAAANPISYALKSDLDRIEAREPQQESRITLAQRMLANLRRPSSDIITKRQIDIIQAVIAQERSQPVVFVSYPRTASEHGELLCERLSQAKYHPTRYQVADGTVIVEEVLKHIEECDYFVGIWHPEEDGNPKAVSPWMPFEYGIALALRRKCVIVHSRKLDKSVRQRISPEVAQAEYSDVKFESETCPVVIDNLNRYLAG